MLENTTIKVRNSNTRKTNTYFIIFSILSSVIAFVLIPEFAKYLLAADEEVQMQLKLTLLWRRGLPGLAAGIVFALFGIKKFNSSLCISLIRLFLITFILLLAMYYLITR